MLARRLLPFVASLFVCLAATATTVEQRSPFRQGHWWDPSRSGHGFELLNADGTHDGGELFALACGVWLASAALLWLGRDTIAGLISQIRKEA